MNKKNDLVYIALCSLMGLVAAYAFSGPLRKPASVQIIGTPLASGAAPESVEPSVYVKGTISLASGLSSRAASYPVLFLIAKPAQGGPPVAVRRLEGVSFPLSFSLTSKDGMTNQNSFYDGDIIFSARLDKDGVAGPAQQDDMEIVVPVAASGDRVVNATISK